MRSIPQLEKIKEQFSILIEKYNLVADLIDYKKDVNVHTFSLSNEYMKITFHGERFEKDLFTIKITVAKYPRIPILLKKLYYYLNFHEPEEHERIKIFNEHAFFLEKYYNNLFLGDFKNFDKLIIFSFKISFFYALKNRMPKKHPVNALKSNDIRWIQMMEKEFYKRRYEDVNTYLQNIKFKNASKYNIDLMVSRKKQVIDSLFQYVCNEDTFINTEVSHLTNH